MQTLLYRSLPSYGGRFLEIQRILKRPKRLVGTWQFERGSRIREE